MSWKNKENFVEMLDLLMESFKKSIGRDLTEKEKSCALNQVLKWSKEEANFISVKNKLLSTLRK